MTKQLEDRVIKLEEQASDTTAVLVELKESFNSLNETVKTQMENLIAALAGVNKVDISTMNKIVVILGIVIAGLLFTVVFLLTGEKLPLPTL